MKVDTIVCSACGYDLTGSPADGACSECGMSVAESRRKHFDKRVGEAAVMHVSLGLLAVAAACSAIACLLLAIAWMPHVRESCVFAGAVVVGIAAGLAAPMHLSSRRVCEPFGGLVSPRRHLRLATVATIIVLPMSMYAWRYAPFATPTVAVAVRAAVVTWFLVALTGFLTALANHFGMEETLRRPTLYATMTAAVLGIASTAASEIGVRASLDVFLALVTSLAAAAAALLVAAWAFRLLRPLRQIMKTAAAETP